MLPESTIQFLSSLVIAVAALPLAACFLVLLPRLFGINTSENYTYNIARSAFGIACVLALSLLMVLSDGPRQVHYGHWFAVGPDIFEIVFSIDILGLAYGSFSILLIAVVAAFSRRYLHREHGFHRFYALLMLFSAGLAMVSFAGDLDVLLIGWELVGVSSTLLIAFFNRRPKPIRNALRAFVTYRVCDLGLVLAILSLHAGHHGADFVVREGSAWLALAPGPDTLTACLIGICLIFAAMGKSAQVPFSGWLPRAMEGPTPSSAVFYGALSVHLGPFLLLRCSEFVHASWLVSALLCVIGGLTAVHGSLVGRVQTDIKCVLAYGSITQVGLIMVEISLGLHVLAVFHILGHAGYRAMQILRAPSLLHDRHHLEQMLGHHVSHDQALNGSPNTWLATPGGYRWAISRGDLDALLTDRVVGRVVQLVRRYDTIEVSVSRTLAQLVLRYLPSKLTSSQEKSHAS